MNLNVVGYVCVRRLCNSLLLRCVSCSQLFIMFHFLYIQTHRIGQTQNKTCYYSSFWLLWRTKFILSNIPTSLFTIMLLLTNSSGESGHETIVLHYWRAAGDILESLARTSAVNYELRLWRCDEGVVRGEDAGGGRMIGAGTVGGGGGE